jgi:G3E family GTPase
VKTEKCSVALDQVLGLDAFSLERVLEIEPDFLDEDHTHEHEEDITSVSLASDTPLDERKFQAWFGKLLRERGQDILRSKGILDFKGQDERFVVHAVHMLTDGAPLGPWPKGKPRASKLVFIGRDLDKMGLAEGFAACKAA